jgi:Flp pilus assembly protein TadG
MMMLRRLFSCNRGAAAAEMALITPLAVLIMFTSIEAGHYFYQQHQVVKGVRDGARFAARQSFDDINCRGGTPTPITDPLLTEIKNLTRTGQLTGGSPRIPNWVDSITITVTCPDTSTIAEATTGIFRPAEPAPQVNIVATPSYDSLFNGLGILTDSVSLRGEQQSVVMGI